MPLIPEREQRAGVDPLRQRILVVVVVVVVQPVVELLRVARVARAVAVERARSSWSTMA
jgi:hypothetical protein